MAATTAPEQQADSARAVLAAVREARAAADREEVRILELALDWAAIHGPGDTESLGFERSKVPAPPALDRGLQQAWMLATPATASAVGQGPKLASPPHLSTFVAGGPQYQ